MLMCSLLMLRKHLPHGLFNQRGVIYDNKFILVFNINAYNTWKIRVHTVLFYFIAYNFTLIVIYIWHKISEYINHFSFGYTFLNPNVRICKANIFHVESIKKISRPWVGFKHINDFDNWRVLHLQFFFYRKISLQNNVS